MGVPVLRRRVTARALERSKKFQKAPKGYLKTVNYYYCYYYYYITTCEGISKGKGKAIPLQAWTGPVGSRRLRLPDFKTIAT
jgi:hypothetical protein